MACTCIGVDCTQVTIDGITYCDCLVSQNTSCPDGSTLISDGDGGLICRTVYSIDPSVGSIITTDVANGYSYNSETQKSEKSILIEPCPAGYTFVPTSDGVGQCIPAIGDDMLLCPVGYTYDAANKKCTKITYNEPIETTVTSCKADIVIVSGINTESVEHESTFVNTFINNIASSLDDVSFNLRVGVTNCSYTSNGANNDMPYLYSGVAVSSGTGSDPASVVIKNYFPTSPSKEQNCIVQGITRAARALYKSETITFSGKLPARDNVRKIIILISQHGPTSNKEYTVKPFGSCLGNNNVTNFEGHYDPGYSSYLEMRKAVNQAKCLLAENPLLEIFSVWSGTNGDPVIYNYNEGQFFSDMRSVGGNPYIINPSNTEYVAYNLINDIYAIQDKPYAPAVCGTTVTYSCPLGQSLVDGYCQSLDIQIAKSCDSTCTIVPSGDNAVCLCETPSVPTLCGDCPILNNKCNCVSTQKVTTTPLYTKISLDDPKYFEKIEWTISYDPKSKMWLSFHDWHPTLLIPSHSHFFTIKDNSFWKHNERFDSFTNYYNVDDADITKDYGWEVEYNIVTPNQITTLRSIEYYMEAYKYYNNGKDMFHVLDENFDRAIIYNSEQVSPLLNLKVKDKNNPLQQLSYPIVGPINTQILASKEENKYRFNTFYDITKDRQEFATSAVTVPGFMTAGSGTAVPMFVTAPNGYHKSINPDYVDVLKTPLEHKKFRHFGNKIVLRKTSSGDKKMLLKIVNSKMLNSPR